jgi:hypothetical protein
MRQASKIDPTVEGNLNSGLSNLNREISNNLEIWPKMDRDLEIAFQLQENFNEILENSEIRNLVKRSEEVDQPIQRVYQVMLTVARYQN